jgi:hypothetical protein
MKSRLNLVLGIFVLVRILELAVGVKVLVIAWRQLWEPVSVIAHLF